MGRPIAIGAVLLTALAIWWALQDAPQPKGAQAPQVATPIGESSPPEPTPSGKKVQTRKSAPKLPANRPHAASPEAKARQIQDKIATQAPPPPTMKDLDEAPKGQLSKVDIKMGIEEAIPVVQRCYEQALEASPDLAGKVVVRFSIAAKDGSGRLKDAEIIKDGIGNPFLGMCMLGAIGKIEFPVPDNEGIVVVNYPFNLQPDKEE